MGASRPPFVWILGSDSLVGPELELALGVEGIPFRRLSEDAEVYWPVKGPHGVWVVNCRNVGTPRDEENGTLWMRKMAEGLCWAQKAREVGARFVHMSSDRVFEERKRQWSEEEVPRPSDRYGRWEADGERLVSEACPSSFILRSSCIYGVHGANLVGDLLARMRTGETLSLSPLGVGSPTWARDLAGMILELILAEREDFGVFHVTAEGTTTEMGLGVAIHRAVWRLGLVDRPVPLAMEFGCLGYHGIALSNAKFRKAFGLSLPPWRTSLERFLLTLA